MGAYVFIAANWGWIVGFIVLALAFWLAVRSVRHDTAIIDAYADADAYRRSARHLVTVTDECPEFVYVRSGFDTFPVRCGAKPGAVHRDECRFRTGRHAADGNSVLESEKAVA